MLKKIFIIITLLTFATGVLFTSFWRTSVRSLEKTEVLLEGNEVAVSQSVSGSEKEIDYQLTWPGILPDHFLYPVKMIRDKVWLWLTTDSLKRTDLLLKFADKRIWAAQLLADKGKFDLGISTASKAEKYLDRAIAEAKEIQEKNGEMGKVWNRLSQATLKHEQVLMGIRDKIGESERSTVDDLLVFPRRGYEEIEKIIEKD